MLNNPNFYPTPEWLGKKMIAPYQDAIRKGNVFALDPSAGKADLLNLVIATEDTHHNRNAVNRYYAIEIDIELRTFLAGIPKIKILAEDFLSYTSDRYINLIVMNPPFDNDAEHFVKAYDILSEGDLVCLFNTSTIKNPRGFAANRVQEIIKETNAEVEHLGSCFQDAERKTNVSVTMVRLKKVAQDNPFQFDNMNLKQRVGSENIDFNAMDSSQALATNNLLENMLNAKNECKYAVIELIKALKKIEYYSPAIGYNIKSVLDVASASITTSKCNERLVYDEILSSICFSAWNKIFQSYDYSKLFTNDFTATFRKYLETQRQADFTEENVLSALSFVFQSKSSIIDKSLESLFDRLTEYADGSNKLFWKTNSHYKLNKKFIMPNVGSMSKAGSYQYFSFSYSSRFEQWADDLDKCCCNIMAIDYNSLCRYISKPTDREKPQTLVCAVKEFVKNNNFWTKGWQTCHFFKFRVFKKGTIHVEFLDEYLWEQFNIRATKNRNWLSDENETKRTRKSKE